MDMAIRYQEKKEDPAVYSKYTNEDHLRRMVEC
jgi:hypothetical protein